MEDIRKRKKAKQKAIKLLKKNGYKLKNFKLQQKDNYYKMTRLSTFL